MLSHKQDLLEGKKVTISQKLDFKNKASCNSVFLQITSINLFLTKNEITKGLNDKKK